MATQNGVTENDPRIASLNERVSGQGAHIVSIENEMRRNFESVNVTLSNINAKLETQQKPQWQALGVLLTGIVVIGTLAYWPIRESQSRIESNLTALANSTVTLREYDNNRVLSRNDNNNRFDKIEKALADIVPRAEHARAWDGINQRFTDMQRQIDQNTTNNASVYTARDQIIDMRNQMRNIMEMVDDVKKQVFTTTGSSINRSGGM